MRIYLTAKVGTGTHPDPFRAKYFTPGPEQIVTALTTATPIGGEPWMLVTSDATITEHTAVTAQPDVVTIPQDLTSRPTAGQVTTIQSRLASMGLPHAWITPSLTYRQIVTGLLKLCLLQQRAFPKLRLLTGGVTLDTPFNQLPPSVRLALGVAADRLKLDTAGTTGTVTLQTALITLAKQLPPIVAHGEFF